MKGFEGLEPMKADIGRNEAHEVVKNYSAEQEKATKLLIGTGQEVPELVLKLQSEKMTVLAWALNRAGADFGYFKNVRGTDDVATLLAQFAAAEKAEEKELAKQIADIVAD